MNNKTIDMDTIRLKDHKLLCPQIQDSYIEMYKNLKENS